MFQVDILCCLQNHMHEWNDNIAKLIPMYRYNLNISNSYCIPLYMFIYFDLICTFYVVFYLECRKANLSRNTGLAQKELSCSSSQQAPTLCTAHISDTHSSFSHFQLAFSSHKPKQAVCWLGIWKEECFLCDVVMWYLGSLWLTRGFVR